MLPLQDRLEWIDGEHFVPNGRIDQAVQVGGTNVFPAYVAEVLAMHPGVAQCAVRLMRPDEGTRLKAFVVAAEGCAPAPLRAELASWLAERLGRPSGRRRFLSARRCRASRVANRPTGSSTPGSDRFLLRRHEHRRGRRLRGRGIGTRMQQVVVVVFFLRPLPAPAHSGSPCRYRSCAVAASRQTPHRSSRRSRASRLPARDARLPGAWPAPPACSRARSAARGWRRIRARPASAARHSPSRPRPRYSRRSRRTSRRWRRWWCRSCRRCRCAPGAWSRPRRCRSASRRAAWSR
jgi:hypothetical protein